jgi:hypothetical protein
MIKYILLHSSFAMLTVLTNVVVIDMIFMSITIIIVIKLLVFAKHLCFEKERGE